VCICFLRGSHFFHHVVSSVSLICLTENDYLLETVNELIYTPKSERDFGTLACWGKNSIGKQSEPCLFQIVPAGNYDITFLFMYLFLRFFCVLYCKTVLFLKKN
jgi:hypothetical protein